MEKPVTAVLESVRGVFKKRADDHQSTLEGLATRLLDDANALTPAALTKALDDLGADATALEAAMERIDAARKREATRTELQTRADSFESIRAELRALAVERDEHKAATEAHIQEMKRVASEIE